MSTIWRSGLDKAIRRFLKTAVVSSAIVIISTYGWQPSFFKFQEKPSLQLSSQRLEETVRYLSETIGTRNTFSYAHLNDAAQYIEDALKGYGYKVESWPYEVEGKVFSNIVARLQNNDSQEYILVGAHYDSCFNPGADDNASGVAGLLELARNFKMDALNVNVMFVAFTNEEPPFFKTQWMGSRVFVRDLNAKGILVRSAIILEMIGFYSSRGFSQKYLPLLGPFYPNQGDFIAVVGNFSSKSLVERFQDSFRQNKSFPLSAIVAPDMVPGLNFSDHASFWEAGIPAVMVTDTAYLRNKHYHQMTDTADTLDYVKMAMLVDGIRNAIIDLANH